MNFHALGPIGLLNSLIGEDYKHHMVLAQYLYGKDMEPTDYFMFYRRRTSSFKYNVILDNGVYEGSKVSMDVLLRATIDLQPQVVILPDFPHNMLATLTSGEAFKVLMRRNKHQLKNVKTMCVVHAEPGNYTQFCHSYKEACKLADVVGISRLTEDFGEGINSFYRRADFLTRLKAEKLFEASKQHHALGMRDGSPLELVSLTEAGFNSCDSSSPIWRGLGEKRDFNPNWSGSYSAEKVKQLWDPVQAACGQAKEASIGD